MDPSDPPSHVEVTVESAKHPCETERGAGFLRERLALFARVGFLIALAFWALRVALSAILAESFDSLYFATRTGIVHLACCAVFAGLWWLCAGGLCLSLRMLLVADGASTIAVGALCVGTSRIETGDPAEAYGLLLALTNTVVLRAVVVPSSAWRTLWTSTAALLPGLAVVLWVNAVSAPLAAGASGALSQVMYAAWCACAVAVAAVASRVIYGLQRQVQQAKRLGQYTLEEKIGEGGMGVVYRARHAMLRRPTAVKLLHPDKARGAGLLRFEREVQLTSRLTHPNTVLIYDFGRTPDGVFYYAMEYLEGLNLDQLVKSDGPQCPARTIYIVRQVCASLREAHAAGLVHRDIKPANVILCERGGLHDVVKVVDFGLVKDLAAAGDPALTSDRAITGTPLFLSPEAIRSPESVDARSDVYAVGALAYFLVTGKFLFESKSFVEVCSFQLHVVPQPPSARIDQPVPGDLEALILKCLEKDPERRPSGAPALLEALDRLEDAGGWGEQAARGWWQAHENVLARLRAKRSAEPGAPAVVGVLDTHANLSVGAVYIPRGHVRDISSPAPTEAQPPGAHQAPRRGRPRVAADAGEGPPPPRGG